MRRIVTAILAAGVVAIAVGATTATAAPPRPAVGVFRAAAQYVGLSPQELLAELKTGRSLAQVATGHGKTVDGLKSALHDAVKAGLDKAVANKRITEDKAKEALAKLDENLDQIVNHEGPPPPPRRHHRPLVFVLKTSADYIGVTPQELATDLRSSGKSLAQEATGHGKTVAGLKAALHDAAKAGLDTAVADKHITADRAKEILAKFDESLDTLVNRTGPAKP